jgi:hypothetical protein
MFSHKFKALAAAKAKVARLEKAVSAELQRELAALPARYGFADVAAFVRAVKSEAGARRGRRTSTTKTGSRTRRRKRRVITDAIRSKVKTLVEADKKGPEIARTLKISGQSVHNIKKSLGLVKVRS